MSSEGTPSAAELDVKGVRIGLCASRFNDEYSKALLAGALETLNAHGATVDGPHLVAGAFELPVIARALAKSGCDAVVALGCIIRGETPHFHLIANESARGLMDVMLETGVPVANGIIATESMAQAHARIAPGNNKGSEAALAALEAYVSLRAIN